MEEDMTAQLLADTGVAGVVGDRVHWGRAPQGVLYPYLRLSLISDVADYTMSGAESFRAARVQIDAFGKSATSVIEAIRAARLALSGQVFGVVQGCFVIDEGDGAGADNPAEAYHRQIDFRVCV